MLRRLYDWVIRLAGHPRAIPILGVVSFLESSVFPIPPDVMLVPMMLANRKRAFALAAWCTLWSVTGGMLGYAIGALFWKCAHPWHNAGHSAVYHIHRHSGLNRGTSLTVSLLIA